MAKLQYFDTESLSLPSISTGTQRKSEGSQNGKEIGTYLLC